MLGPHEQILQVDARSAQPRRERREEQREPGGVAGELGNHRLGRGALAEQRLRKHRLGPGDPLGGALVVRELAYELQKQRHVTPLGGADPGRSAQPSGGGVISRLRILPVGPFGSSSTNQMYRGYL